MMQNKLWLCRSLCFIIQAPATHTSEQVHSFEQFRKTSVLIMDPL